MLNQRKLKYERNDGKKHTYCIDFIYIFCVFSQKKFRDPERGPEGGSRFCLHPANSNKDADTAVKFSLWLTPFR